ncbi:HlyD family efflux transporter periplasmic adaptor subunit [Candidatus Galacturonibacter soehngenii]|uniref:HlyD family efflux transporter periplasmic adaptor subunit n=1 Tax=Candidatus Galacturonatibacter soehngenii TaxID=2307010 RepID=A0A7V7UDL0_9FIRM|nr:HlyD family efflux transporter periplasmic adaptor subunit [Candidatus Galacturonibacter soehngenii]KAB1441258.1 HlyD family efflux transporter periplasmic adaptor subunit [Candidatus Galacturonibacter soehngenii]
MNETARKRREWVKNAAIIFLSVMLVLTFFSNTFMNYSLPEVATQTVTSGSITTKVRGTGAVSVSEPYNVSIKESRVIKAVAVKKGDTVEKGAVLFELEDSDSTELKEAEATLSQLVLDYQKAILNGDTSLNKVNQIENGQLTDMSTMQKQVESAKNAVKAAEDNVANWTAEVASVQKQIDLLNNEVVDTSDEEAAVEKAQSKLEEAKSNLAEAEINVTMGIENATVKRVRKSYEKAKAALDEAQQLYDEAKKKWDNDPTNKALETEASSRKTTLSQIQKENENILSKRKVLENYDKAAEKVDKYQKALDKANSNLKSETNKNKNELADLNSQLIEANSQLTQANADLTDAQKNQEEILKKVLEEVDLGGQNEKIKDQQELVEKLRSKAIGATIEAPVAGTITTINKTAGETTTPDEAMAVIQVAEKGYSMSISVSDQQSKNVKVGDKAEIQDSWNYEGVTVTLAGIKPDPESGGKNKLLTFDVTGEIQEGQQLNISVGNKSANYDLIVPSSSIREDKNGKFILTVESKNSPLGNRYIATRVDVEVLASDDTQTAVSGALYGYEYVITTATKPVEAGKQVRLADN